ncbi:MAG: sporulation protein YqfD [Lachnospiraceae bacterium]|nr:sporulation protein YqfD [Lachnospiraceae bacterium]
MVNMINWLKGYVRIRVSGTSVERFINLCGYRNILLWDLCRKEEYYEMFISLSAFRQLRPIAKKTRIKVAILQRVGLPFLMSDLNKRKIFLFCSLLAVFFWFISGYFIWNIQINGNYLITTEQIQDFLKEQEISIGKQKKYIDIEKMEKDMRISFPKITWVSGKIQGTTLLLDIKESENTIEKERIEEGVQYDLIAHEDGVIDSIIVRKGQPKVKPEDIVTKGMVLVEGLLPVMNDDGTLKEELYVSSDADVYIRYDYLYEDSLEEGYVKKIYTGRSTTIPYIRFGEKELVIHHEPDYLYSDVLIQESTSNLLNELHIPLHWGKFQHREYLNMETIYTKKEATDLLEENFMKFLTTLSEKGVQIIEKDVTINKSDNKWIMEGKLTISEPVTTLKKVENKKPEDIMENN